VEWFGVEKKNIDLFGPVRRWLSDARGRGKDCIIPL